MKHKNLFMVPNSIFELELKPRELAVYCCLLKYCDEDMTCYPSRSTISKDTINCKSTVASYKDKHKISKPENE